MKLRTKLLLGVGILLFAMVTIMYILPTMFVRKDIYSAADEIHALLIAEQKQLMRSQHIWLQNALEATKESNDAILFMLYEAPHFRSSIVFTDQTPEKNIWIALSQIVGYDPNIGFVQAHDPKLDKTARISSHDATLYPLDKLSKNGTRILISLLQEPSTKKQKSYIGYPLPSEMQKEEGFIVYALVDPKKIQEQIPEIDQEIRELTPEFVEKQLAESKPLDSTLLDRHQPGFEWALKINMIRTLTPLYAEGLAISKKGITVAPEGLARVDATGNGYAILSPEIFSTQPLFDDEKYYKLHQPKNVSLPLARGSVIITNQKSNAAYIGNTLLLNNIYFTIATPLDFLARQLSLSSNKLVLLLVNQNFWVGFDGLGNKISEETLQKIIAKNILEKINGVVEFDNRSYFFTRVSTLENAHLAFFEFHPFGGERSILSTLLSLEDKLSGRISLLLSLIAIGTMVLVLLFIGRIGFTIIYPITKLASATKFVASGRYEEISLPDVGHRKDEVAILTHAFDEMVTGLKEREKIRGVLDKVVSKDVADEILRTQIHLGGEDRIVTMLFCDIRGFTNITAHLPPQKTIEILNACMTKVSRVIESEGGVIDKYVGDEVMAIFGAPTTHPDHALRAVSTGLLITETLKKWNLERVEAGEPALEMGIGIHTGLVVVGNMGAEDRLNYTVLGANVNLAARLCEAAKPNQVLVSESTLSEPNIRESFYTKPLAPITLKGFDEQIKIFEIVGFKWDDA